MKNVKLNMTEGPAFFKLLKFSIPLIFSNLLQLLFNAADVIVVGRFAGDNSLAAVGSTTSLINLLVNLFVGLSIGCNVVTANYFGAKEQSAKQLSSNDKLCRNQKKDLNDCIHTSILLSIYGGFFLTIIGIVFSKPLLILMQAPKEVLNLATVYLRIYFSGVTASVVYNFGAAILRAKGDTKRPLYILFSAGIINVILNLVFVIFAKMDVKGVALATVISQIISAVSVIFLLLNEEEDFRLDLKKLAINRTILIKIIKIGVPAGFQGIIFSLSNVVIQSSVNTFGATIIAANSAAQSIEGFVYTAMNGFSQGTLTFTSQNMGARKKDRVIRVTWISQITVFATGLILGFSVIVFGKELLGIYSNSQSVIQIGLSRLKIICATYAVCGLMDCMANTIRGIGYSTVPMLITLIGACGTRILWLATIFQMQKFHTLSCIYLSYPLSWFITYVSLILALKIVTKKAFLNFANK